MGLDPITDDRDGLPPEIPFMALADIFICAVSVVFILLLLAEPKRVLVQHPPQSDYLLRCVPDGVVVTGRDAADVSEAPQAFSFEELGPRLAALEPGDALSVRLLIQQSAGPLDCARRTAEIVGELNKNLSERLLRGAPGVYLLHDIEVLPKEPGAETAAAGGGGSGRGG